jgi:Flp pilus assembly protein TadG
MAGQSLVEFALAVPLFIFLTLGLLDGVRVIFYYTQIQEAARQGARWGAVQVARSIDSTSARTVGGDFATLGNEPGTYIYCAPSSCPSGTYPITATTIATGAVTPTIVGATLRATTAVNLAQATITIATPITQPVELTPTSTYFTNEPITVTVAYPFKPVLGMVFGGVSIPLKGTSVMLHE